MEHFPTVVEEDEDVKVVVEIVGAKETRLGLFVLTRGLRVPAVGCPSDEFPLRGSAPDRRGPAPTMRGTSRLPVPRPLPYSLDSCSAFAAGGEDVGAVEEVAPGVEPID